MMPRFVEPMRLGLALTMLSAGGCYFQVPPSTAPDFVVLNQGSQRVAADVHSEPDPAPDSDDSNEHVHITLEQVVELPKPPWQHRPALAPSSPERSGEEWAQLRQLELNEQLRDLVPGWQDTWCPLVLSFDGRPVRFESARKGTEARFETGGPTACASIDWPTASTPWLVRDLNANGMIDGGHELFGTGTRMSDNTLATGGFEALGVLDTNGDGRITSADPGWSSLALWFDHDRDRKTGPGELVSLDEAGVRAFVLTYTHDPECDARGNCMIERSTFEWVDREGDRQTGALIDVHLACRGAQR